MSENKDESQPSTLSEAEAEQALAKAEYEAAKAEAGEKREAGQFSNKRKQDRIFRREMGEPEFFLMDRDTPLTPILTGDEIEELDIKDLGLEISKIVERKLLLKYGRSYKAG